jgi:hypothetical protein
MRFSCGHDTLRQVGIVAGNGSQIRHRQPNRAAAVDRSEGWSVIEKPISSKRLAARSGGPNLSFISTNPLKLSPSLISTQNGLFSALARVRLSRRSSEKKSGSITGPSGRRARSAVDLSLVFAVDLIEQIEPQYRSPTVILSPFSELLTLDPRPLMNVPFRESRSLTHIHGTLDSLGAAVMRAADARPACR